MSPEEAQNMWDIRIEGMKTIGETFLYVTEWEREEHEQILSHLPYIVDLSKALDQRQRIMDALTILARDLPIKVPEHYICSNCGAHGCKLWRQYQTFADHLELLCAVCAAQDQQKSIVGIDEDGSRPSGGSGAYPTTDTIGWLVPAIVVGDTYWGYTSVPDDGVIWWRALPTLPVTMAWQEVDGQGSD